MKKCLVSALSVIFSITCTPALQTESIPATRGHNYQTYLLAHYQHVQGNNAKAQDLYAHLFNAGASPYAYQSYLEFLESTERYDHIVRLIPYLKGRFDDDVPVQLLFVKALEHSKQTEKAIEQTRALYVKHKDSAVVVHTLARMYAAREQYTNALRVMQEFVQQYPTAQQTFLFYFTQAQLHMLMNNPSKAQIAINACLERRPNFEQGWLLYGLLHELQGNIHDAVKGYRRSIDLTGSNPAIEEHIAAISLATQPKEQRTDTHTVTFAQAVQAFKHKEFEQALQLINRVLQATPRDIHARLLQVESLINMNKLSTALDLLQQWALAEPREGTWLKALHLTHQARPEKQEILKRFVAIEQALDQHALTKLYLADIYLKERRSDFAARYLNKALPLITSPAIKTKIYFQLALSYFEQENYAAMEQALCTGDALKQSFAPLKNLLAWFYATKGKQLAKAEECISAALAQEPNNPHYLDTKALIYYKQKKFTAAQTLLERVQTMLPHDQYVLKHLAKVYRKQSMHAPALKLMDTLIKSAHTEKQKRQYQAKLATWKQGQKHKK